MVREQDNVRRALMQLDQLVGDAYLSPFSKGFEEGIRQSLEIIQSQCGSYPSLARYCEDLSARVERSRILEAEAGPPYTGLLGILTAIKILEWNLDRLP